MDTVEMKQVEGGVCAAKGFSANGLNCGLNPDRNKNDLALIYSERICKAAAVYTTNKVKGAPILVTKKNLAASGNLARAVIANSKNANTCNADGEEKAARMCELAANELGIPANEVIVASTGVIGQILPIEPIESHITELAAEAAAKTRTAFPRRAKESTAPGPYRETAHDEDIGRLRAEAGHISGGTVFRTVPGLKVPGGRPPGG